MLNPSRQRIAIVGTSGSGKTTLAHQVAERLHIPHVELDALHWEPNWTMVSDPLFRDRVSQALRGDRWVVDGNYSKVRNLIWSRADTVVFLDYPFHTVLLRLLRRTVLRSLRQQELWNGNRENWRMSFFSQDSILLWMIKTHQRNRIRYPLLFQQPDYAHLTVVHLRDPGQAEDWVAHLIAEECRF
jgi:adenylate kinase family enzyme